MKRRALLAAPALLAPGLAPRAASAQENWPSRAVTMLVPWAPGGSNDVVARLFSPGLEARTGHPFLIDNKPGGGGSVGMGQAMRARPDGHALFVSSASNHVFYPLISGDLGYDVREAFHGMAMWVDVPNVVAVHPSVPAQNIPELIAHIRATPGGMSFGSSGVGSSNHLAGELFRMRTGLDMTHVPYRGGGPVLADLIGGTIKLAFMNLPTVIPPAEAGRVKVIAVCTGQRVSLRPDLPTVSEGGVPDYAVRSWTGLFAPKSTPDAIVQRMSNLSKEIMETPQMRARLADLGSEPIWMDAATTDRFVREEYERWTPVVRASGVRIE
ncbi:Bug family tripartite tricarboxylate transporter substrate binding protein [Roseococcus pinisoli]|uniref:Tripartite tricarboxylate transporter substrate binding protein n=1 Tax=Roseococcus pinisoli TaxID=2835040 RepID=A0ABS5QBQ0_9PROT|nr:tripartite tricarboxylate transporter substrate binding protein [Roseococcus pinisoli]MBS7810863.1 tripartite tricarboxylate transporter substrate binding protein [Roseococcus pinisoli]